MSDDLIKRSDAIEAIEDTTWYHQNRNKDMVSGANSDEHQAWYKAQDIYEALETVPKADRPQGEWKITNTYKDHNGRVVDRVEHTDCGYVWHREMGEPLHNYCPNCGSPMKGADDE